MTLSSREIQRLNYIAESIRLVEEYTNHNHDRLMHDRMVQDAVLYRLETLADASNKLPTEVKE